MNAEELIAHFKPQIGSVIGRIRVYVDDCDKYDIALSLLLDIAFRFGEADPAYFFNYWRKAVRFRLYKELRQQQRCGVPIGDSTELSGSEDLATPEALFEVAETLNKCSLRGNVDARSESKSIDDLLFEVETKPRSKSRTLLALKSAARKAYYERNSDREKAYSREYRRTHNKPALTEEEREYHRTYNREKSAIRRQENPEAVKAYAARYRKTHREEIRAKAKAWKREHPQYVPVSELTPEELEKRREAERAKYAAWCSKNPERVKAAKARHYEKHREEIKAKAAARRANRKGALESESGR